MLTRLTAERKRLIQESQAHSHEDKIGDWHGKAVEFGHIVQLQHLLSGKFLTLNSSSVARHNPGMPEVVLAAGSEAAWIKLKTRCQPYKSISRLQFQSCPHFNHTTNLVLLVDGITTPTEYNDSMMNGTGLFKNALNKHST